MNIKDKIGIIGFGRFGSLFSDFLSKDFYIYCYDKNKYKKTENNKIKFVSLKEAASCDIVFFCVPIIYFEDVVKDSLPYIKKGAIVADVLSVKLYPHEVMLKYFASKEVHIILTHPFFGPESAVNGLEGLPFVICSEKETSDIATDFLYDYLSRRGLRVVKMSCEEHDRITAYSLCVSQFIGRLLNGIGVQDSNIDTDNFKNLLKTKQIAMNDTFDLFKGLQLYNPFAEEMRMKVKNEMKKIEKELKRDIE